MHDVVPVLQAIRETGFDSPFLASQTEHAIDSRTLGRLVRNERCVRAFSFDSDGTPVEQYETWGDLANALSAGDVRLAVP